MNNHKSLWKTNNFQLIRVLLCIVPLFVPSCAKFTYNEAKFNIFKNEPSHFESAVFKSLEDTRNFFAQPELEQAVLFSRFAVAGLLPALSPITGVIYVLDALFAQEGDWRGIFSEALARETRREIALFAVDSMNSMVKTIQKNYHLLNSTGVLDRKLAAFFIHSNIDSMLNYFDGKDSLFKKYPLVATPLLIQLAQLIALFEPVAKVINEEQAKNAELSCLIRNILIDYRPRAVNDRMEKLHSYEGGIKSKVIVPEMLSFAMSGKYDPHGYSISIPPSFNCERCPVNDRHRKRNCLFDDFGEPYIITESCVNDYALFVRHRVEEMFSAELIDTLTSSCSHPPRATGFGWLTIKIKDVRATRLQTAQACDEFSACDPFVKIFIDRSLELETAVRSNDCCHRVDAIYTTNKITKKELVKIEVWDHNDYLPNVIILKAEHTVESWLSEGHRKFKVTAIVGLLPWEDQNFINTISFWQDEYK